MKNLIAVFLSSLMLFPSCQNNSDEEKKASTAKVLKSGTWRGVLDLGKQNLPFNFILLENKGSYELAITNAKEKITVNKITQIGDSLHIQMPVFDSEFQLRILDSTKLEGIWINNYYSADYKVPFLANYGENYRFTKETNTENVNISGKYEVTFAPGTEKEKKAIGVFEQGNKNKTANHLKGTFITETGDYRHLEGVFINDSLYLSGFDGAHAYLFTAVLEDNQLNGTFYSGTHFEQEWTAVKNEDFELRDPDSLTFLKEGYEEINFSFPNLKGEQVSLDDEKFEDKVVIIQVMGSWCPNCMDETVYLTELHNRYQEQGLEVVALAFERTNSREKAIDLLESLKVTFGSKYDFLLASNDKEVGPDSLLPMLDHFISFPTAIFIDRKGNVRKIHAGFYGPGTGNYYIKFKEETDAFVLKLLEEKAR